MDDWTMGSGTAIAEVRHARLEKVMQVMRIYDRSIAGLIRFRAAEYMLAETKKGRDFWAESEIREIFRRESILQRRGYYRWLLKG